MGKYSAGMDIQPKQVKIDQTKNALNNTCCCFGVSSLRQLRLTCSSSKKKLLENRVEFGEMEGEEEAEFGDDDDDDEGDRTLTPVTVALLFDVLLGD